MAAGTIQQMSACSAMPSAILATALTADPEQFFRSILALFLDRIPLGCMAILMLHHLTGG